MGADLVCFIVVKGPRKIASETQMRAVRHAEMVIARVKELCVLAKKDERTAAEETQLRNGYQSYLLACFRIQEPRYESAEEAIEDLESLVAIDAAAEVKGFVKWWEEGESQDTARRVDPDDDAQQIVVCADTRHRGPPDGEGFSVMRRAYWFGIPQQLGIR